jgi:hypothetical protein
MMFAIRTSADAEVVRVVHFHFGFALTWKGSL